MKKVLLVFGIAAFLTACNSEGASSDNLEDSALEQIDSTFDAKIDSLQETADSVKQTVQATFDATDSANRASTDTAR